MGSFAETAYRLPFIFSNHGKQTFVFCFHLQQTNGNLPFRLLKTNGRCRFPFADCGIPETWRHGHGDMVMEIWTWKSGHRDIRQKTEVHSSFFNLFTICSVWKRKFVVCLFVDNETKGSYLFSNRPDGRAHLW